MTRSNETGAIVKTHGDTHISKGIVPNTFEELIQFSKLIKATPKFLPKGKVNYSVEELAVNIQLGLEIGLTVMQAIQGIMIINGAASVWGDYMIGLVLASGKLKTVKEWTKNSFPGKDYTAHCRVYRHGITDMVERTYSIEDAERASLKTDIWKRYPKRMLQMRARSWALRDMFGDVLKGLVAVEEAVDYNKKDEQVVISGINATGYQETCAGEDNPKNNIGENVGEFGEKEEKLHKGQILESYESLVDRKCSGSAEGHCSCKGQSSESLDENKTKLNTTDKQLEISSQEAVTKCITDKLLEIYRDEKGVLELLELLQLKENSPVTRYLDMVNATMAKYNEYIESFCSRGEIDRETVELRAKLNFKTFWKTFYGWLMEAKNVES